MRNALAALATCAALAAGLPASAAEPQPDRFAATAEDRTVHGLVTRWARREFPGRTVAWDLDHDWPLNADALNETARPRVAASFGAALQRLNLSMEREIRTDPPRLHACVHENAVVIRAIANPCGGRLLATPSDG